MRRAAVAALRFFWSGLGGAVALTRLRVAAYSPPLERGTRVHPEIQG